MNNHKVKFFFNSLYKNLTSSDLNCPACNGRSGKTVDRKFIVTTLRRCSQCRLLFRSPTTTAAEFKRYYQIEYQEGFTTTLPNDEELARELSTNFSDSQRSYALYIEVLEALGFGLGSRILDFGCSWGYGSYQLAKHGYQVDSFEISEPRRAFAKKLGCNTIDSDALKNNSYDVFLSVDVIEHVDDVRSFIQTGMHSLNENGVFVAFGANGSKDFKIKHPDQFHKLWGYHHPQLIDDVFLLHNLVDCNLVIDSIPYSIGRLKNYDWKTRTILELNEFQIMVACQKTSLRNISN